MPPERVLVVDDDAAVRGLLVLICRRAGFEVDAAAGGAEALEAIERGDYLMAVLDLQMPGMNGFDVIERLSLRSKRPYILVLSALPPAALVGIDSDVVQAIVRKPFDVDLVTSVLTEFARIHRGQQQQSHPVSADEEIRPN